MTPRLETPDVISIKIPFHATQRGGRKEMRLPASAPVRSSANCDTSLKALARAFRWKRMLDTAEVSTVNDLAAKERIARSYVARILRLTTLAPAILDAVVARELNFELDALLDATTAAAWVEQQRLLQTGYGPSHPTTTQMVAHQNLGS
jgi:hypothetical protein